MPEKVPIYLAAMLAASIVFILPCVSQATPEYSADTGQGCRTCHVSKEGGGLTQTGLEYAASGYSWPPRGGFRAMGPIRKGVRLAIGYLHVLSSFAWFGAILYVHILLRPGYASKGLPRGEAILGLVSMVTVGATGVLLTFSRIGGLDVLYETTWGGLLSAKIAIYVVMAGSAVVTVAFIGPRLKGRRGKPAIPKSGVFDSATLSAFDGSDDRPSFIAFDGRVYEVTDLKLWKGGMHMKHPAGTDLTRAIDKAPHGPEKLNQAKERGAFDPSAMAPLSTVQKAFYAVAYMNLSLVFVVIFILALWRWGA